MDKSFKQLLAEVLNDSVELEKIESRIKQIEKGIAANEAMLLIQSPIVEKILCDDMKAGPAIYHKELLRQNRLELLKRRINRKKLKYIRIKFEAKPLGWEAYDKNGKCIVSGSTLDGVCEKISAAVLPAGIESLRT